MQNDQQKKYHTKSRDAIMTYLDMHREHSFSAYDVNAYMRENGIQVNLTTIVEPGLPLETLLSFRFSYQLCDHEVQDGRG